MATNVHSVTGIIPQRIPEGSSSAFFNSSVELGACQNLLGCGRDIKLEVLAGHEGLVTTGQVRAIHHVFNFFVDVEAEAHVRYALQYDGADVSGDFLNVTGLGTSCRTVEVPITSYRQL
jgi:hypothetical protein